MNKKRPVNLDLASLRYPPMAIVSILHRISGIMLFLLLPFVLYILAQSLRSDELFQNTKALFHYPSYKLVLWVFTAALSYHIVAGIRHLIMDMGFGEHLGAGRNSAILVLIASLIIGVLLGIWIW